MQLDIRTLTLVGTGAAMLFSVLGIVVARGRHNCPGFGLWISSNLCAALALCFVSLNGIVPDIIAIVGANVFGVAASLFGLQGVRAFHGDTRPWWSAFAVAGLALPCIIYFRFAVNNLNIRVEIFSFCLGTVTLIAAKQILSAVRPGYGLSLRFLAFVLAVSGLIQYARGIYAFFQPPMKSLFTPSPVFAALMIASLWGIIAGSLGYFLINYDHMVENVKQAQARAAGASAAKSQFLANASHEIRTPMNGVIGLTELLLDTPLDATQRDYVETVRDSGIALLEIINELLDLSKIEAGRLELAEDAFDPREVVEQTVDLLSWKAESKGLKLLWDVEQKVPSNLVGDAGRLRQVLTNLAGNSIKFTPSGHVSIRVSFDNSLLRFSVTDTGPGIAKEQQTRLFERFEQMHNGRQNGTGLGLAISKELAQRMGGGIGVVSDTGQGSTFWFTAAPKQVLNDLNSSKMRGHEALNG
jgi:signal transduction histidine kinase